MSNGDRLSRLEGQNISAMSAGEARAALRDIAVIRGTTDHLEAAIARHIRDLHTEGKAAPPADALGRNGHTSRRAAEKAERRADTLGHTPRLDRALASGKVGTEHADALASAAAPLDERQRGKLFANDGELTELAASHSPETFRRKLTSMVDDIKGDDGLDRAERQTEAATLSSGVNDDTGMYWFRAELAPEDGNRVRRAIDHEANALAKMPEHAGKRRDQLDAAALVSLVTGARSEAKTPRTDLIVIVPLDRLDGTNSDAPAPEYSDGTTMPVATARRQACEANIIPVVLDGDGMPLDVGRSRRLASPSQRAALRSMYRTCAIDGCDRNFDRCHVHHIDEWEHNGPTDLDNLVPLCSFHHHRTHEGRWRLQLDSSTRRLTVHLPNGSVHSQSIPDLIAERAA